MWTSLDVTGHPVGLFEPSGGRLVAALIFLHDEDRSRAHQTSGDTLADDSKATEFFEHHRLACLCPYGGLSWWSNRICETFDPAQSAEQWLMESVAPLIERWSLPPNAVALAGVGMGGQGALRLAFRHPERFPIVAAVDASIDHYERYGEGSPLDEMYPSREHCRQDSAILHIHPARQPAHIWFSADPANRCFRGNDRLHEKLTALGVRHEFLGQRCRIYEAFATILTGLREESRRLI
jgi:pimeloyl-ACP methyl ester carboxylesterase